MKIVILILAAASIVNGEICQSSDVCTVEGGIAGLCVPITSCLPLLEMVTNEDGPAADENYLKTLICKFDNSVPQVCCKNSCCTPEGDIGICIGDIDQCEHLKKYKSIAERSSGVKNYLQRSSCKGDTKNSVCCPTDASLNNTNELQTNCSRQNFIPKPGCCGFDNSDDRIIPGSVTNIEQYPWLALIEYEMPNKTIKLLCSGSLINSKYVISAAYCFIEPITQIGTPKNIRLGEFNTSNENEIDCVKNFVVGFTCNDPIVTIAIDTVITHPLYNAKTKKNDIALIKMKNYAPYTSFIKPVCLPEFDDATKSLSSKMFVSGWGGVNENMTSSVKLHVRMHLIRQTKCQATYIRPILTNQVCAGTSNVGDTCKVSPGAPLMFRTPDGRIDLVGIASLIPTRCNGTLPGVFTNVFEFKEWIYHNIIS